MSERRIYLGVSGSGKSCLMLDDLEEHPRIVTFNTLGESSLDEGAPYERFEQCESYVGLINRLYDNDPFFRLCYAPEGKLSLSEEFDQVCEAVLACQNLVFAVDEVHLFARPVKLPGPLEVLISTGRKRQLSFFCAAQRAASVHPLIRSQATVITTFNQTEPSDLAWLRESIGDLADRVPELKGHDYLRWRRGLEPFFSAPPSKDLTQSVASC